MNRHQPVRTRTRDTDHGSLLVTETSVHEHAWEDRLGEIQNQMDKLKAQVRQAQQLAHLGTVAAMIAHEVNNLLTPIRSYAQAALDSEDPTLRKKALVVTLKNVDMLVAMTGRVLEIGAAKTGDRRTVAVRRLAEQGHHDRDIAAWLNGHGFLTIYGLSFDRARVCAFRHHHGIPSRWAEANQLCTIKQAAEKLGVCRDIVARWIKDGLLKEVERRNGVATWVRLTQEDLRRLRGDWNPEIEWSVKQAAAHLGIPIATVYGRYFHGRISGRRVRIGRKWRWLIPKTEVLEWKQELDAKKIRG